MSNTILVKNIFIRITLFPQDIQSIIENNDNKVSFGIIFVNDKIVINDLPTSINQEIRFVNINTWRVYEHYVINKKNIINQLGYFDNDFDYVPLITISFVERRSNFHGYQMMTMTEEVPPFISIDLSSAPFDDKSQTYD